MGGVEVRTTRLLASIFSAAAVSSLSSSTSAFAAEREKKFERVSRRWPKKWLTSRPAPGLVCFICAEFARQRFCLFLCVLRLDDLPNSLT